MTERKGTTRRRRSRSAADAVPESLARWFEHGGKVPWSAPIYPDYVLIRERWQAWSSGRPGARPPDGYEWITAPPPKLMHGMPWEQALAQAKACARRGARLGIRY